MNLSISSIAWDAAQDEAVAEILAEHGVKSVELAPTKLWPEIIKDSPNAVTDQQINDALSIWRSRGITPVAMQSMLFLRPDLTIFQTELLRQQTLAYLRDFITLSGRMGIGIMVFGSPKNRQVPEGMEAAEASNIAQSFFAELGRAARENNVKFCLEPNPTDYACNFATTAAEGAELVRSVNDEGFRLHLDAAGMALAGDDLAESIRTHFDIMHHFHISAPYLGNISEDTSINHELIAATLREVGYEHAISIEMRPAESPEQNLQNVTNALVKAKAIYAA